MSFRWVIYLFLIAIGFYFGKYLGAVTLPVLYFYVFHYPKKPITSEKPTITTIHWAYRILQVPANADMKTIKKARKQLINQYHPDKLPITANDEEKQQASERINEINRAFEAIINIRHEK